MYNVIITGKLLPGATPEAALPAFARLLKVDLAKARSIIQSAPVAIRRDADEVTAKRIQKAFTAMGVQCVLKPVAEEQPATPAEPASVHAEEETKTETETETAAKPEAAVPTFRGLTFNIEGQPDYSFITVQIPAEKMLRVEASAMATMSTNMVMKTRVKGGLGRLVTGESLFINEFSADGGAGEIGIAPGSPGDVKHLYLDNEEVFLQNSAFVACGIGVLTETKWQGLTKGFFSGESLFLIRCSGVGDLWFNTYGAMIEIDVAGDYVVDTGNIVGFTSGLEYSVKMVGGYKSAFFSGEGLVCRFSGHGKVWIQTRSVPAFASWANFYRPAKS
jgi:uncharacterized protein (TIGR00266 family)